MAEYWFTCPKCSVMASIDDDQAEGRVSIQCVTEGCDFHETGTVRPLIPTTEATKPSQAPSFFVDDNWAENIVRMKLGALRYGGAVAMKIISFAWTTPVDGFTPRQLWLAWLAARPAMWVVRFEVMALASTDREA